VNSCGRRGDSCVRRFVCGFQVKCWVTLVCGMREQQQQQRTQQQPPPQKPGAPVIVEGKFDVVSRRASEESLTRVP